ncbi:hypothetical protein MRX96_038818 [Rhipicephalus microplus]
MHLSQESPSTLKKPPSMPSLMKCLSKDKSMRSCFIRGGVAHVPFHSPSQMSNQIG